MSSGIIIHITVGKEKQTEFFSSERISIGTEETSDLQIRTDKITDAGEELRRGQQSKSNHFNNSQKRVRLKFGGK